MASTDPIKWSLGSRTHRDGNPLRADAFTALLERNRARREARLARERQRRRQRAFGILVLATLLVAAAIVGVALAVLP